MLSSALLHKRIKEENKIIEQQKEKEYRIKYLEKIKEEEELDRINAQKKKQKELELKMEVEKQWQQKLAQYQLQKEEELKNQEKLKIQEKAKKYIIEQEKQRLIKENESLLKSYYPLGYQKAINSLKKDVNNNPIDNMPNNDTKYEIIKNNIFGNSNPNRTTAYPKLGKIKNYVYDKSIQDVNHKINITNYPMYNATANNNYDSYPTPEEYLKLMKQSGQKNFSYAGNTDTTGIPMRSQMPVYANRALSRSISTGNGLQNNFSKVSRRNLIKSNSSIYSNKEIPMMKNYKIEKVNKMGLHNESTNNIGKNNLEEKGPIPA